MNAPVPPYVDELLREKARLEQLVRQLQHEITGYQMGSQDLASKWRGKVQAIENELKFAQRGLTSGCGCPIGKCLKRGADGGSCWLQWAEGHLLKRMGSQRIDEVMRAGNHPRRFRELPNAQPADQSPPLSLDHKENT